MDFRCELVFSTLSYLKPHSLLHYQSFLTPSMHLTMYLLHFLTLLTWVAHILHWGILSCDSHLKQLFSSFSFSIYVIPIFKQTSFLPSSFLVLLHVCFNGYISSILIAYYPFFLLHVLYFIAYRWFYWTYSNFTSILNLTCIFPLHHPTLIVCRTSSSCWNYYYCHLDIRS